MSKVRMCSASGCTEPARQQCFECGTWHCAQHLSEVQMPTFVSSFRELICTACLQPHMEAADRFGFITLDPPLGDVSAAGAFGD